MLSMSPTARPTCFQISNWVIAILPVESILRRRGKTASSSKLYDLNSTTITAQFPYVFLETSQNICTYPSFAADHWESVLENIRQKSDLWKNLEQLAFIILIQVIFFVGEWCKHAKTRRNTMAATTHFCLSPCQDHPLAFELSPAVNNRPYSYSRHWTGTSL